MRDSIRRFLSLFTLLCAVTAVAEPLPEPRNITVFSRDAAAVVRQLVGAGIELPGGLATVKAFDAAGNEIVWREARRSTDSLGYTHVFYRQHLVANGAETELYGSEVGVHFTPAGAFRYVGGTQFENVFVTNRPRFSRLEAVRRANGRLRTFRGESEDSRPAVAETQAFRAEKTNMRLVQVNDEFRYAYFTFAEDADGGFHSVVIDAENDRMLGISDANPGGNCFPSDRAAGVDAIGIPVRSGVANRVMRASVSSTRPSPYTHEGYYHTTSSTAYPSQSVYQETSATAFKCDNNVPVSYTLFPLQTNANGVPVYDDSNNGGWWEGRAAGDALYHTYQTMRAFGSLGRKGWNNSNTEAKIIVNSTAGDSRYSWNVAADQAMFIRTPKDGKAMVNSVVIGPASMYYNMAASLDLVAHEWGHGVIFDEVGLDYDTAEHGQIHEGYADVIGNIVEKMRQPAGYGLESSSDWTMHEDVATSGYARGAHDDGTGHSWVGPNGSRTVNDKVHRLDTSGTFTGAHPFGNMLVMAYRLLAEGGRNEVCSRSGTSTWQGCASGFQVNGVGASKARWIMFEAIYEMPSTVTWETIANYVNEAAFKMYNGCSIYAGNAHYEQQAVADAFLSIGYPRTDPEITCGF